MQTSQEVPSSESPIQPKPAGLWSLMDWSNLFCILKGEAEALRQAEQDIESEDPQQP